MRRFVLPKHPAWIRKSSQEGRIISYSEERLRRDLTSFEIDIKKIKITFAPSSPETK